ncbi:putative transposase [Trichonephila clavipes]|uniref:Putative transposase n=1 Tax=Trichonephila clavipes TaxID=2585209 RepID=A0A8X7BDU4_TRICX|nr:putative transposase [Trichonephila clavipes]
MNLAAEGPQFQKPLKMSLKVRDLVRSDRRLTASKNIPVAPQPPYSSDLSPCDFFLFPKLKNHLKGHHFGILENIQTAVTDQLKAIPISEFHQCYEVRKKRLQRCVASEGSYFEGDNVESPMTLHSPIAVLNHKILEANSQVQNVKLGGHQTCLSINRLWHELCDMLRRLVGTTAPGHHDCSIQE